MKSTLDQQLAERDFKKQSRELEKALDKERMDAQIQKRKAEDQEAHDRQRELQAHYREALNVQVHLVSPWT